ncbi:Protein MSO1 [Nakaseomyces bracarensis]|uniref:Protein MSO1 n=1 Tax=Nakaseomyces bracarensis TaxID=273131 RepID=A0ABR4NSL4_9SACH
MSEQGSSNIWSKFRTSTKSLSNSLSQLSIKPETDGSTPTTTVVHKSLVKFYKHQEPFQGFPGWLGHKEDLPDQQKILKKQQKGPGMAEQLTSKFDHIRSSSNEKNVLRPESGGRPTTGQLFHSIYDKPASTNDLSSMNAPARAPLRTRSTWASNADTEAAQPSGNEPQRSKSNAGINGTDMMRARLLRRNTRPLNNV